MNLPYQPDFSGKVAVVTGGAGVLCAMFAKALARCGARVAVLDLALDKAEELSSLRAGDVTIEVRGGANRERAAALRRSARQLMAPYTEGGGFFFCAVKG